MAGTIISLLSLSGLRAGVFEGYRLQASDALFPVGETHPDVAVVAVDTRSLAELDQAWPWPRGLHARIVEELARAGAGTIVYDLILHPAAEGDDDLGSAIEAHGDVLLASLPFASSAPGRPLMRSEGFIAPVDVLAERAAGVAHAAVTFDPIDGVVRSLPLLIESEVGELVPSLALAAFQRSEGLDPPYTIRPSGVQFSGRFVPTGRLTVMDVSFSERLHVDHPQAPLLSASDVIAGELEPGSLQGRTVFVGVTDPALGDHRPTPAAKVGGMPGVLIHANAFNTLITRAWIRPASHLETTLWIFLIAAAICLVTAMSRLRWALPAAMGALVVYLALAVLRFGGGTVMDLIYPPLAALVAVAAGLGIRSLTEQRQYSWVADLLSRYVPDPVARDLIRTDRLDAVLSGERIEVCVLYCDLRGFTALAATLDPEEVRELLNTYYEETSAVILEHGGTLMQFVGDEVFSVFGAPAKLDDERRQALSCAKALIAAQPRIAARLGARGLPEISYGIGLHWGEVVATHLGSARRRQYAVVGDTVNCGARLCSLAGAGEIVASEGSFPEGPPPQAEPLEGVTLKGIERDLRPYRLSASVGDTTLMP